MRAIWLIFTALLLALGLGRYWLRRGPAAPSLVAATPVAPVLAVVEHRPGPTPPLADSVVRFALRQRGAAYCYAGSSPATGFDCSGFVRYVFGRFGLDMPHATAQLIGVGRLVPRAAARPGDIVVFTGTDSASTAPGHAGIVVSGAGERPLRFVHASSARREPGVKVSQVEGSGYERRFLAVRRVL